MGSVWGTEVSRTSGIASYEIVRGQASASSFSDKFSLPEGCHLVGNRTFEDKNMDLSAGCGKYQGSYFFSSSGSHPYGTFVGLGVIDKKGHYTQVLPKTVFNGAVKTFNQLESNIQLKYQDLFDHCTKDGKIDPIALRSVLSVLAYGKDFAEYFVSADIEGTKNSLSNNKYFFPHNPHLRLHYLNTGKAASEFSSLVEAFGNNPYILCDVLDYELSNIEDEMQESNVTDDISCELLEECKSTLSEVQERLSQDNYVINDLDLNKYLKKLGKIFEKMSSIGQPSNPIPIVKAKFHDKSLSCKTNTEHTVNTPTFFNPLVKFKHQPLFEDITPRDFENPKFLATCWKEAFSCGTMSLKVKDGIAHYKTVMIKACEKENQKYILIHDPTKAHTKDPTEARHIKRINIQL